VVFDAEASDFDVLYTFTFRRTPATRVHKHVLHGLTAGVANKIKTWSHWSARFTH